MKVKSVDRVYGQMLSDILNDGSEMVGRNSKTKRLRNLTATFTSPPLISLRKTAWKNALREWEWFMSGSTNIADLAPQVHSWWAPWADADGNVKNNYGQQFREAESKGFKVDQLQRLIDTVKNDPGSRRAIITTWNAADMANPETPLTNCHSSLLQAFVEPDNTLHITTTQRSCDMILGVPHNLIQAWAFLQYLSVQTGRKVGSLTWIGGDCHIYEDHYEIAREIAETSFLTSMKTPRLIYSGKDGDAFKAADFALWGKYQPIIKARPKLIV